MIGVGFVVYEDYWGDVKCECFYGWIDKEVCVVDDLVVGDYLWDDFVYLFEVVGEFGLDECFLYDLLVEYVFFEVE